MSLLIPRAWLTHECIEAAEGRPPRGASIPVLRLPFVERWLARAHPAVPLAWCGPLAAVPLAWCGPLAALALWSFATQGGSWGRGLALVAAGWLGFSLFEYLLHRFAFHRAFSDTEEGRIEAFLTHGYHHLYPNDAMRLVMPPMIAWPIAALIWASLRLALGPAAAPAVFVGVLLGYVAYDGVHYYVHHARPTTRLGRWMRRYHMLHHHDERGSRFGVSSPLWDVLLGTYQPVEQLAPRPGRRGRSRQQEAG